MPIFNLSTMACYYLKQYHINPELINFFHLIDFIILLSNINPYSVYYKSLTLYDYLFNISNFISPFVIYLFQNSDILFICFFSSCLAFYPYQFHFSLAYFIIFSIHFLMIFEHSHLFRYFNKSVLHY